ncbi:MAG: hypothetical protein ABH842_05795 [Candidatus Micrarchaeota archaeon]
MERKLLEKGNTSLALGTVFGVSALTCPCPLCIIPSISFFANSIREKFFGE